jgi:hypothetical protein
MKASSIRPGWRDRLVVFRTIVLEGILVALAGIVFALIANHFSPRGLGLNRDYFPGATRRPWLLAAGSSPRASRMNTTILSELVATRLKAQGLQLVDSNQVAVLFHDARYAQELVVFVDARNDREYQKGHVPSAYQLDHYHPENYLPTVLPVCQTADQIVVYCAVKFDCGCGLGEVWICSKLAENCALIFLSGWLLTGRGRQFSARFSMRI